MTGGDLDEHKMHRPSGRILTGSAILFGSSRHKDAVFVPLACPQKSSGEWTDLIAFAAVPENISTATASASAAQALLLHAARQGLAIPALVARFELDPKVLADVDGRIPLSTLARMWEELPALCNDPDLGIHMQWLHAEADSLVGQLCRQGPTFGAVLTLAIRYERITQDVANQPVTVLSREGDFVHVTVEAKRSCIRPPTQAIAFGLSAIPLIGPKLCGRATPMTAATLRHPGAMDERAYREAFGVRVVFGAAQDRLTMPASYLEYPVQQPSSSVLLHILERHAQSILAKLPSNGLNSNLRAALCDLLPSGDATLAKVAKRLRLAPRTLQRHLSAAGLSLSGVLDDVRRELALEYVRREGVSLCDIAFALGFADQSSFTRAFRRWTAHSPRDLRNSSHGAIPTEE